MVRVKHDNQYITYILEDNSKFFPTGYRVLQKQKEKGFIPCSKILYNGHIKLLYPIGNYESIAFAAEEWDLREIITWMLRILKVMLEVRDNGFIQFDTVDVELSRIFIETDIKKVHIIALPLTVEAGKNSLFCWENELEKSLISLIEISLVRNTPEAAGLIQVIRQDIASLDSLYRKIKRKASDLKISSNTKELKGEEDGREKEELEKQGILHLVTRSSTKKADIPIVKDSFVLGKNPRLVDGVLTMTPTISRVHCRIIREGGKYYIEDLDSVNHTFVNGYLVKKGEKVPVKPGDQIRLAEVEFSLEYREQ